VADVPACAKSVVVIGVIAEPTAPVVDAVEIVRPGFVINEAVVVVAPIPDELTAATVAMYSVPGASPVIAALVVVEVSEIVAPVATSVRVIAYPVIFAPPLDVGAVIAILAVVVLPAGTVGIAANGAVGTAAITPTVTVSVALKTTPAIVTAAVIV